MPGKGVSCQLHCLRLFIHLSSHCVSEGVFETCLFRKRYFYKNLCSYLKRLFCPNVCFRSQTIRRKVIQIKGKLI